MTDQAIRIEACRLAIAACPRDLPFDERMMEISALVMFFEQMICRADAPADADGPHPDYPKIGDPI